MDRWKLILVRNFQSRSLKRVSSLPLACPRSYFFIRRLIRKKGRSVLFLVLRTGVACLSKGLQKPGWRTVTQLHSRRSRGRERSEIWKAQRVKGGEVGEGKNRTGALPPTQVTVYRFHVIYG